MSGKESSGSEKKKIAILGGGISALSTAFELTNYEGWEEHYEITLYQMGWRVGGKTASSRGVNGRIQERGIHILQGWYDNAFRMLKEAYSEREAKGISPDNPYQTWRDALRPDDATLITEWNDTLRQWTSVPIVFPNNDEEPGTSGQPPITDLINKGVALLLELIIGSPYGDGDDGHSWWPDWLRKHFFKDPDGPQFLENGLRDHGWWPELKEELGGATHHTTQSVMHWVKQEVEQQLEQATTDPEEWQTTYAKIVPLLERLFHWMEERIDDSLDHHPRAKLLVNLIELAIVNLKGIMADVYNPKTHTFDFKRINKYDYREWLTKHGASERVLACGIVRFMYYGSFANRFEFQQGRLAANVAVHMTLLLVSYKGAFVWKFMAGTGDTLIAPIYQVLKERGVTFKFFHKVSNLVPDELGRIQQIQIDRQVDLKEGVDAYSPMIQMPDGVDAWPEHPLFDQLNQRQAAELKANEINLESNWADWEPVGELTLNHGDDFDEVVLGIPVNALKDICQPLMQQKEKWKKMISKVEATPTFGVQLWFEPNQKEMGFDVNEWGIEKGTEPNSVIYANPLYSWTSMSLVIPQENWPKSIQPGQLSYFCGTWDVPNELPPYSDHGYPERLRENLMATSKQWVRDKMGWFFPEATEPNYPEGLDLRLLVHPDPDQQHANPDEKYRQQYFTVNIEPSEHYTLAIPGTDKYRLKPAESGYQNLYLCGDWTDFGLNVGYMEGAVTSGLQAAQGLRRRLGLGGHREIYSKHTESDYAITE
ncbi:MAG: FAD-dependent oxidoreductase [Bacteroidota bacterium]